MLNNKKAAMELTMGTMVTMVLLVGVLILGGFLVNKIFFGATESVDSINQEVTNQINQLFSDDSSRKIIVYPQSRYIELKKGSSGSGFAFSIRNTDSQEATFDWTISAGDTDCQSLTTTQADTFLGLGKIGSKPLAPGDVMNPYEYVRINIPESAPPCSVRYNLKVTRGGSIYGSPIGVDVKILSN